MIVTKGYGYKKGIIVTQGYGYREIFFFPYPIPRGREAEDKDQSDEASSRLFTIEANSKLNTQEADSRDYSIEAEEREN